jgi:uncharacterized protein YoxC
MSCHAMLFSINFTIIVVTLPRNIDECNLEIDELIHQIEAIENRTEQRYTECSSVIESVQNLLDNVSSDTRMFK